MRHTGSEPRHVYPSAEDVLDRAEKITWHQDEPFGSTSIFAQWCVFEEAKRAGLTVMLDGQGADEPIAGYHGSFSYYLRELHDRRRWSELARTVCARRFVHGTPVSQQLFGLPLPAMGARLLGLVSGGTMGPVARDWLDSESMRELPPLGSVLDHAVDRLRMERVTDLRTLCLAMTFAISLPALLHYEDRDSMAHGIEGRVPFLDHRLVEFVLSLGSEHKIRHADTKRVMRTAMKGVLPEMVRNRRDKLGFSTPEEIWFRGTLKEKVKEGVESTLKHYPELLDAGETRLLVDDYLDGRRPFDSTPWRIVNVGIWGRVMGVSM